MDTSSAQVILDKILSDAREYASGSVRDARERAARMQAEADARLEKRRRETLTQAERDAEQAVKRAHRMAELEERKALLQTRRDVMDVAFDQALAALLALPAEQKRAYFLRVLLGCALGGEAVRVGEARADWYGDAFLAEANAALAKKGVQPLIRAAGAPARGCGIVLERGGAQINLTFESAIQSKRLSLEADVARVLFPG